MYWTKMYKFEKKKSPQNPTEYLTHAYVEVPLKDVM